MIWLIFGGKFVIGDWGRGRLRDLRRGRCYLVHSGFRGGIGERVRQGRFQRSAERSDEFSPRGVRWKRGLELVQPGWGEFAGRVRQNEAVPEGSRQLSGQQFGELLPS